jgi:hypothetical protein
LRLGREGDALTGRYFLENLGVDIGLRGTVSASGEMTLVEGSPTAPSGHFDGRCEEPSGALSGEWKGAKGSAAGAFRLVPITPSETPIVATKRFTLEGHGHVAKGEDASDRPYGAPGWDCAYTETRSELFGLLDPKVERMLNDQGLEVETGPRLVIEDFDKNVRSCKGGGISAERSKEVQRTFRELATIQTTGSFYGEGAIHPWFNMGFERATWDLRSGKAVGPNDVLARDPTDMLVGCAGDAGDPALGPNGGWETLSQQFDLTETGIHFFAVGFPHFNDMTGEGPVISYGILLRDGYLRKDSPVKRAWAGVSAAPKGANPCEGPWK